MSSLLALMGGEVPTSSVVNAYSSGGNSTTGLAASSANSAREVLSGALTAGTLSAAILSISGKGEVPLLSVYSKDATARTVRIVVEVDGQAVPVFDATSNSATAAGQGIPVVGMFPASTYFIPGGSPVRFNSSFSVKVASSLTETDKVAVAYVCTKR